MEAQVIYKIINAVNNKFYVGSTVNTAKRFRNHKSRLQRGVHHCRHLQAAWNKYGEAAFLFVVVETVPEGQSLFEAENRWLHEHVGKPYCYNAGRSAEAPMRGLFGEANPNFGRLISEEQKESISRTLKEFYAADPNNHPMRGKKQSAESVAKANATRKANGKAVGENHYRYGKTLSEEVREKIGATQRGKPKAPGRKLSEEGRAKILASAAAGNYSHWKGRKHTEEAKQKLRKEVKAVDPRGVVHYFDSLTTTLETLGFLMPTLTRALKTNKPLSKGPLAGWVFSYREDNVEAPHIPEEFLPYPRSRQEAKTTGAKFYFTGVPCSRGHVALRLTKGACEVCRREDWSKKSLDTPKQPC